MIEELQKIRDLLDNIEKSNNIQEIDSVKANFDFLELPQIIKDIVDFLQPALSRYVKPFHTGNYFVSCNAFA